MIKEYNMLIDPGSQAHGLLLTDKEKRNYPREKFRRVKVNTKDIYFFFGGRFSDKIIEL